MSFFEIPEGMLDVLRQIAIEEKREEARKSRPSPPTGYLYFDEAAAELSRRLAHDAGAAAAARIQLDAAINVGVVAAVSARTKLKTVPGNMQDRDDCLVAIESLQAWCGHDIRVPKPRSERWTPEMLDELAAYRAGHTAKETADRYGVSQSLIRKLLARRKPERHGFSGLRSGLK